MKTSVTSNAKRLADLVYELLKDSGTRQPSRRRTTTMTTTITITMSERRPLKIEPELWPVIAEADWHNGQYECQANTIRRIRVRQHVDGRRIVYGWQQAGDGGQHAGTRNPAAGFLLPADADEGETIRAIRRVGGVIDDDALADECIGDLPAEDIDGSEQAGVQS